jgi:hypothetical protein
MKRIITFTAILIACAVNFAGAQQDEQAAFTLGEHKVGIYVGTGVRHTTLFGENAGLLELRGAFTFNRRWSVGLMGASLWYDKSLHELVDDGSYRLEMGYGGLYVERMFPLTNDLILSASVATGYGVAAYRYDKEYHAEKTWTEETIDQTTFAFFEPGLTLQWNFSGNFWLGASAHYRNTSPVELLGTSEDVFRKFSGGLTLTYGLF